MHMIDLRLRPERLVAHAQHQGHNRSRDEDLGYAVHGWLRAALGDVAPVTFRLLETREGGLRLLGYSRAEAAALREHAMAFAEPAAAAVCDWESAASKDMAAIPWRAGQRVGFECRVCPVVRGKAGERDAFLASLPTNAEPAGVSRAEVYRAWMLRRLQPAAELDEQSFRLKAFRLVSTWRLSNRRRNGHRAGRPVVRPDALVSGSLTVSDPAAFGELVERGVGRHRAFGFGMLLLRPA